jgi:hypothetical protein
MGNIQRKPAAQLFMLLSFSHVISHPASSTAPPKAVPARVLCVVCEEARGRELDRTQQQPKVLARRQDHRRRVEHEEG